METQLGCSERTNASGVTPDFTVQIYMLDLMCQMVRISRKSHSLRDCFPPS